ncbi:GTP-binding protein [Nocardia crassostreae]|uniref:GTP-binding protein n=1 Tax=Nocardia crassostreae TaxID=53428 RepID=UPI000829C1C1|nr:GTP-binding protein [Nocardia crassostreae]
MGAEAIDPQTIRNVTILGEPSETAPVVHRLLRRATGAQPTLHWVTDRVEHIIRIGERPSGSPIPDLERSIRTADAVVAVVDATLRNAARLDTVLRIADDHQVARLCLIDGLDRLGADFDHCVRAIAATRGAMPVVLQLPMGVGADFDGVIDLIPTGATEPVTAEFPGSHGETAERWYRRLVRTVLEQDTAESVRQLHRRIRERTRIGDVVPILCGAPPRTEDITPLLDAITRCLPSPMDVCQPEHVLDY